jgi:hypothetical protein
LIHFSGKFLKSIKISLFQNETVTKHAVEIGKYLKSILKEYGELTVLCYVRQITENFKNRFFELKNNVFGTW